MRIGFLFKSGSNLLISSSIVWIELVEIKLLSSARFDWAFNKPEKAKSIKNVASILFIIILQNLEIYYHKKTLELAYHKINRIVSYFLSYIFDKYL